MPRCTSAQLLQPAEGGKTSAALRIFLRASVARAHHITRNKQRCDARGGRSLARLRGIAVAHGFRGGRTPAKYPPPCALFHRRSRNRFCAETVNKTADWPRSRIVQQTDWPRCIRIDMQEWPPCHGVTHGVALLRRFWLIRHMGGKYTCKVGFRAWAISSAYFA